MGKRKRNQQVLVKMYMEQKLLGVKGVQRRQVAAELEKHENMNTTHFKLYNAIHAKIKK